MSQDLPLPASASAATNHKQSRYLKWKKASCQPKDGNEKNIPTCLSGYTMSCVGGSRIFLFGGLMQSSRKSAATSASAGSNSNGKSSSNCRAVIPSNNITVPSKDMFLLRLRSSARGDNEWVRVEQAPSLFDGSNSSRESFSSPPPAISLSCPPARFRHSASKISAREILIFGGFGCLAPYERYNDVWVFNAVTMKWKQPISTPTSSIEDGFYLNCPDWKDKPPPSPRGGHAAAVVGEKVYIFGGHGGMGYMLSHLDDIHVLDTVSWEWEEIATVGAGPEGRSGHRACAVGKEIFVFGGTNDGDFTRASADKGKDSFHDLFILDTITNTWTKVNVANNCIGNADDYKDSYPILERSYFATALADSDKIYFFGGRKTVSGLISIGKDYREQYLSSAGFIDTSSKKIVMLDLVPSLLPSPPSILTSDVTEEMEPRSDIEMVYFEEENTIVGYGGYADKWIDDTFFLTVCSTPNQEEGQV